MKQKIAFKYRSAFVIEDNNNAAVRGIATTVAAEMLSLGFVPSEQLLNALSRTTLDGDSVSEIETMINVLKAAKGADVEYVPMYPNFPDQVMDASEVELYFNAILHYLTDGEILPTYDVLPRDIFNENVKYVTVDVINNAEFKNIFASIVSSRDSISASDKDAVEWMINNVSGLPSPKEIPFKENLCFVASLFVQQGKDITPLVSTATDVLRIATAMSGGDISLAENTKFRSLRRKERKMLTLALESVINEEDINRHRNKWIRLFHILHVGDFSQKVYDIASLVRNNEKIETFNGKVEKAIKGGDINTATRLLQTRPGVFARKLDHILRVCGIAKGDVIASFLDVVGKVPTRNLLQLLGHIKGRSEDVSHRVAFPKGSFAHAVTLKNTIDGLGRGNVKGIALGITRELSSRFEKLSPLGKVYIDPNLKSCPVPTQMRSASEGLFQVSRGTRLPFGDDKNTLRFFIYWVGRDIDLSATLHNEKFETIEQISYTNLRSRGYQACHSGDITNAPRGASEFIDITIDGAVERGARYVAMNVYVFVGPSFGEHKKCYAGWMTREKPNSGEIYDPKTVQQKIDLTSASRACVPVIFDLVERKAIWADINTRSINYSYGNINSVETNSASVTEKVQAIVNLNNKVSLYELFALHAMARGTIVDTIEEADIVYSASEGDVTPYNVTLINSEYVV